MLSGCRHLRPLAVVRMGGHDARARACGLRNNNPRNNNASLPQAGD